nr:acyltransferase [uncultured Cohaesibacter sp.]
MFRFFNSPFFSLRTGRDLTVDTIRGLACIALVSYHVVGGAPDQGMALGAEDWLYKFQTSFGNMRMPLFSFISGIVFLSFPLSGVGFGRLFGKKARRLLLPLIVVATFCWLARTIMGLEDVPLYQIYFIPYNVYWYLQSTFLMMTLFLTVNYFAMRGAKPEDYQSIANMNALGLAILGTIVFVFQFHAAPMLFSIHKSFFLMPFFMAGYLFGQVAGAVHRWADPTRKWIAFALIFDFFLLGWSMVDGGTGFETIAKRAICVPVGILAALSIFIIAPRMRLLAWVGDKSYAIFLFHIFFASASEIVWRKLFPSIDIHFGFPLFLAAGVIGPIVLSWFVMQMSLSRWLVLGLPAPKFIQGALSRSMSRSTPRYETR